MLILSIVLGYSLIYFSLLVYYLFHWHRLPSTVSTLSYDEAPGVTVVIVARNEAKGIQACLDGILRQHYPSHFVEVMVIDDYSTDGTKELVQEIQDESISLYALKDFQEYIHDPAYKKSGITLAVDKAKFENILVTDADCIHEDTWLRSMMYAFTTQHSVFQTGPVILTAGSSLLEKMQEMEQLTLMIITGGGIVSGLHDIANGANMLFTKNAFRQVDGYSGNYHYASGDDMFLIEKMRTSFPKQISFAKAPEATVYTKGKDSWDALLRQRLRWAGKNKGLKNQMISRIWLFVGSYHVVVILFALLALCQLSSWLPFFTLLSIKWLADLLIMWTATSFFNRKKLLLYFIPLQFLYTWYLIRLAIVSILGQDDDWKRK